LLNSSEIRRLIEERQLITDFIDLEKQLQPSGFDLSLGEVQSYQGLGRVDFTNEERAIAQSMLLQPDENGWYSLLPGCYAVIYNEVIRMPLHITALARARSTLIRNGVTVETAVWDPGYSGRSRSLLVVHNPHGIKLKKNARIVQLVFFKVGKVEEGYYGMYNKERLNHDEV